MLDSLEVWCRDLTSLLFLKYVQNVNMLVNGSWKCWFHGSCTSYFGIFLPMLTLHYPLSRQGSLHSRRWCCHSELCKQAQGKDWRKPSLARDGEAACDHSQLAVDEIPLQSGTVKETARGSEWEDNRGRNWDSRGRGRGNLPGSCWQIFCHIIFCKTPFY